MKKQLVVMIGYRGSGKSTLAKALAKKIQWKYESSDQLIEREVGPLSQWIPQQGWPAFREKEHKVCQILSRHKDAVIDLGGGAVENPENLKPFSRRAVILWINTDVEILIERLYYGKHRPLLNQVKNIEMNRYQVMREETVEKYRERLPLYQKFSHYRIENNNSPELALTNIFQVLEKYHIINK